MSRRGGLRGDLPTTTPSAHAPRAPRIAALGWLLTAVLGTLVGVSACGPRARPVADVRAKSADPLHPHGPNAPAARGEPTDDGEDDTDASDQDQDHDGDVEATSDAPDPCPEGMVLVETGERRYCIDRYEASLVEVLPDGSEQPYPHYRPVDGHDVRAVSVAGVFPQGFISEVQARDACSASGKRLCTHGEWKTACMGPSGTAFPYGDARRPGACHDQGRSAVVAVFGAKAVAASTPYTPSSVRAASTAPAPATATATAIPAGKKPAHALKGRAAQTVKPRLTRTAAAKPGSKPRATGTSKATKPTSTKSASAKASKKRIVGRASTRPAQVDPGVWAKLNEPGLGQVEGALARTGEHPECVSGYGVVDIVGNLHEWVATDPTLPHGTFAGGYYLDTAQNGDGCHYRTVAHAHDYHDYSTGFRCCADAR